MDVLLAHGTGNDFVVLPDLADTVTVSAALARALCDRSTGLGADGVIRMGAPPDTQRDAEVFMDHRNADGSLAEMCGNGVRVVAKLAVDLGLVAPSDGIVRVATRAGTKPVRIVARDRDQRVTQVAVDMGMPVWAPSDIPFDTDTPDATVHEIAPDSGASVQLSVVSMGNPHGVVLVEDVRSAPVRTLGPALEMHTRFPKGANIGFATVRDRGTIDLRVWERGVGETQACGTGACAAVVTLQRRDLLGDDVTVHLPGGTLQIHHEPGGTVTMTGPATLIARASLDAAWLAAVRDHDDHEVDDH
ncbi:MAG: diaminopimelate epimerase [Nitriliruptoraceae bacterium]|nr:diaminopimelate epimerase [Nitriliruptoraceae bacterium]